MKDLSQQDHSIQPKPQFEDDNLPDQAARFQSAFTAMPDAALLISPIRRPSGEIVDFRLDVANQAALAFMDRSEAGLVGQRLTEVLPHFAETLFKTPSSPRRTADQHLKEQIQIADQWLEVQFIPLPADMGMLVWRALSDSQSQLKTAAQHTRQLEQQIHTLKTTFSAINDFAYIFDREGRFIFINQALLDLWGLRLEEAVGKNFFELPYPVELATKLQQQIQQVFDTGQPLTDETPYTNPSGMSGFYEYIFGPVFAEDGTIEAVAGSTRDITQHKRIEAALRESEANYRTLVEAADDSILLTDLKGVHLFANNAYYTSLGYPIGEDPNTEGFDLVHPDDVPLLKDGLAELFETGAATTEYRIRHRDGSYRDRFTKSRVIKDQTGQPYAILAIIRDITDRKQTEAALRESERRLAQELQAIRRLHQMTMEVVTATNLQTALDAVLSASIEILNADMGDIQLFQQTKKGLKIVAQQGFEPEFLATFDFVDATDNSACGRALRSGQRCIIEDVLADESYAPYRDAARSAGYRAVQSTPLISHNGAMLGILSTHFRQPHSLRDREQKLLDLLGQQAADLIDRLTAEEKLKELNETLEASVIQQTRQVHESEEQFRVLVNASAQIIWTTDAQGVVVADSPSWRSFTGQTFEEWIGWGWTAVLHPEDRTHAAQAWQHAVETETQLNIEYRIYHAENGDYRWTHVRAEPLRAPTGQVRGWVGMNIDIHERKRAEAQLRQLASRLTMAEQEERRRISQILHDDLQQLLYGIQVKLALMRTNGEEAQWTQLAKHQEQAEAWIAAAIMTTRRLTVDLSPPMLQGEGLVNTLNWLVTQMADLHSLAVSVEADHVFQIENEDMRVLLFQIIRELLFNVAKHAETNRAVVILGEADGQLIIRVNDDGRGFDPTLAYNQTKNSFGLFSIRERLGLFGGRLEIVSNRDEGTRITIYVPQPPKPDPASDD